MSMYGYLEVFQRVPGIRNNESLLHILFSYLIEINLLLANFERWLTLSALADNILKNIFSHFSQKTGFDI